MSTPTPQQFDEELRKIGKLSLAERQLKMVCAAACYTVKTITIISTDGLEITIDLTETGNAASALLDGITREVSGLRSEMLAQVNDYE